MYLKHILAYQSVKIYVDNPNNILFLTIKSKQLLLFVWMLHSVYENLWAGYRLYSFSQSLSNFTCKLWVKRGGALLISGQRLKDWLSVYKNLLAGYRLYSFSQSLSNFPCKLWMMRGGPIDFGSRGKRSTLALYVQDIVNKMQTTVFTQSLSNFTCKLWIFLFCYFHLFRVPHTWTGRVQMKSSMSFIQGNRCIEREKDNFKNGGEIKHL